MCPPDFEAVAAQNWPQKYVIFSIEKYLVVNCRKVGYFFQKSAADCHTYLTVKVSFFLQPQIPSFLKAFYERWAPKNSWKQRGLLFYQNFQQKQPSVMRSFSADYF